MDAAQLLRDAVQAQEELVEPVLKWGAGMSQGTIAFFSSDAPVFTEHTWRAFLEVLHIQDEARLTMGLQAIHGIVRSSSKFCEALATADCVEILLERSMKLEKAAVLLSAVMCRHPQAFSQAQLLNLLQARWPELTMLEITANLLKFEEWRKDVWGKCGSKVSAALDSGSVPILYKGLMAVWLVSFSRPELVKTEVVAKVNKVLATSRTEKVVRIALLAIQNMLRSKTLCEEMAECETVAQVSALEYEKWRDPEMPELIKTLLTSLHAEVKLLTNFERFEREVLSGTLKWGFIHSEKFWLQNVLKCEEKNFRIIDLLMAILSSGEPESLAVACHDIGEFARLHPVGKKIAVNKGAKDKMLELMSSPVREVAREALLCVQKLMLIRSDLQLIAA